VVDPPDHPVIMPDGGHAGGVGDVAGFLPSRQGLGFTNAWPSQPDLVVGLPGLGGVPVGDAANGLCGGMVFTVLDLFTAGVGPPAGPRPTFGSPLFTHLVRRLFDSFDLPSGVLRYYAWMVLPDGDRRHRLGTVRGVGWRTVVREWPLIRADVDAGRPCPIGVVTVRSPRPGQLGRNHQLLVYGYRVDGDRVTLRVYDPNTDPPVGDDVTVSFGVGAPSSGAAVTHNVALPGPIRGLFRVRYRPAPPPPAGPRHDPTCTVPLRRRRSRRLRR